MKYTTTDARDKILESAAALFSIQGYHRVSMDLIAGESGVAKGTVYYHFKSKEDLYFAILIRGMDALLGELEKIVAAPNPAQERLHRLAERTVGFFWGNRSFFQILMKQERFPDGEYYFRCKQKGDAIHDLIQQVLERGIEEGSFRDVSTDAAATVLQGMLRALVLDSVEREADQVDHALALDLFLNGLSTDRKRNVPDA